MEDERIWGIGIGVVKKGGEDGENMGHGSGKIGGRVREKGELRNGRLVGRD